MNHDTNEYAFHRDLSQVLQSAWGGGFTPTEKWIAGQLGISRSTLSRMRDSYSCPRGSSGRSTAELDELRQGRRATNVTQTSGISTSGSTGP